MPSLGPTELIIVLVLAFVLFGAGKLADVGGALGKSIREFRRSVSQEDSDKSKPPPSDGSSPPDPQR